MSSLLLDEKPLIILPRLAVLIGLNEAIILQQLHYWLREKRQSPDKYAPSLVNGQWWVYNTLAEWQAQFPFWSGMTIRRALESLEAQGLVVSDTLAPDRRDRTKWYRIDYAVLEAREGVREIAGGDRPNTGDRSAGKKNISIRPERTPASVQNEHMGPVQNEQMHPLNENRCLSETPSETPQRIPQREPAAPGGLPSASSDKAASDVSAPARRGDKTEEEIAVYKRGAAQFKAALDKAALDAARRKAG